MRIFSYAKHFSVAFQRLLARHTPICSFILFNKGGWENKHSQGRCGIDPYPGQDLKIPHSRHSPRLEHLGCVTPGVQDELAPGCYCLTPYITPARCPDPTQVTRLDPQQPAWDQSHKQKVQLNFVWICIPHSILAHAAYLFLSSLHANQFKRLQLKLFSVPTPLNFSTLSSFSCICCCFWSHTSSPLYLLSSIAREPFPLTPHF